MTSKAHWWHAHADNSPRNHEHVWRERGIGKPELSNGCDGASDVVAADGDPNIEIRSRARIAVVRYRL